MGGEERVRRKECKMRLERGVPDAQGLVASARDLELYSECNEKMRRNFSRIQRRSYMCFRKITMTTVWRPD